MILIASCNSGIAQHGRFLKALASKQRTPPSEPDPPANCNHDGAGPDCGTEPSLPSEGVRFDFETFKQFQAVHGMGAETRKPTNSEASNFRKRPNYDASRRKLQRKQRSLISQLEPLIVKLSNDDIC